MASYVNVHDEDVIYHLRDTNKDVVESWTKVFSCYPGNFKMSQGDIFQGAPAVDAIVSSGNSFGIMNSGREQAVVKHFGNQIQERLQKAIHDKYDSELLVGRAAIIPAYEPKGRDESKDWSAFNNGMAIKYFIFAPTTRTGLNVSDTANAYLAFRGVLLAIRKHNKTNDFENMIKSVLIPGLATGGAGMPSIRSAWQMFQAYETYIKGEYPSRLRPESLEDIFLDDFKMRKYAGDN